MFFALKDPLGSVFIYQLASMLFSVCLCHPIFCSLFIPKVRSQCNLKVSVISAKSSVHGKLYFVGASRQGH